MFALITSTMILVALDSATVEKHLHHLITIAITIVIRIDEGIFARVASSIFATMVSILFVTLCNLSTCLSYITLVII